MRKKGVAKDKNLYCVRAHTKKFLDWNIAFEFLLTNHNISWVILRFCSRIVVVEKVCELVHNSRRPDRNQRLISPEMNLSKA